MRRPRSKKKRTGRCSRHRRGIAAVVALLGAASLPCSSVCISAFVALPQQPFGQPQHRPSRRGLPSSFVGGISDSSEPACAFDGRVLLQSSRQTSTSGCTDAGITNNDVNSTNIMSPAVLAQLSEPSTPLPQKQLMLDLPQSPRKRQKAFSTMVVNSVKAGDADSALMLYGKAEEVGCMISENVYNAVLSVCEGDKASSKAVGLWLGLGVQYSCVLWCCMVATVELQGEEKSIWFCTHVPLVTLSHTARVEFENSAIGLREYPIL